jgi:hypothetical protein
MLKKINRFVRNLRQSSTSKKVENSPRTLLEIITDVATIISALGILVAIAQMLSQNAQFKASFELSNKQFELSNKQFRYQLKQDSLQDKADSIKDYRDSVKLQLAINEFAENKKNQVEESKRNESQFEKNIKTLQELVRTNKQSNEYVVNSQKPYLGIEIESIGLKSDSITIIFSTRNYGIRVPLLNKVRYTFVNSNFKVSSSNIGNFIDVQIGNEKSNIEISDYAYYRLLSNSDSNSNETYLILDVDYFDELTKNPHNKLYFFKIQDIKKINPKWQDCNLLEQSTLKNFINLKRFNKQQ